MLVENVMHLNLYLYRLLTLLQFKNRNWYINAILSIDSKCHSDCGAIFHEEKKLRKFSKFQQNDENRSNGNKNLEMHFEWDVLQWKSSQWTLLQVKEISSVE